MARLAYLLLFQLNAGRTVTAAPIEHPRVIICTDTGTPPLAAYRRIVVDVRE